MKNNLSPLLLFILLLTACASQPTVPVASETPTLVPSPTIQPTPTFLPEFVVLQDQIAASGERFILMPDGTIQDDGIAISGLNVDKNGVMTLQVDDQIVELSFEDLSFGDSGIEVKGYTFNEETGEWQPALTPEQQAIKALPAELQLLIADGASFDTEKGVVADVEDGRVLGLQGPDGTWMETPEGNAIFNLTNGEQLAIPIYADIDSALDFAINGENPIWWGNMGAWLQSADTAADIKYRKNIRLAKHWPDIQAGTVFGDVTLCQSESPTTCGYIKVEETVLDDGSRVTQLAWRSKSDANLHSVLMVADTEAVLEKLRDGSVKVPAPTE